MISTKDLEEIKHINDNYAIYSGETKYDINGGTHFHPKENVGEYVNDLVFSLIELQEENDRLHGENLRMKKELLK